MKNFVLLVCIFLTIVFNPQQLKAQSKPSFPIKRCGTVEYYQQLFKTSPEIRKKFELNQKQLSTKSRNTAVATARAQLIEDTIPVVIHVIASAALQTQITDAVLQSQIDILNEDFRGLNKDSTRIPNAFKPLYGKSKLIFTLAKQNEYSEPTSGIVRKVSSLNFDGSNSDDAKRSSLGGSNAWDPSKFMNLWVVNLGTSGLLGISVLPGDPRPLNLHGFVCDYRAFGRNASYLFKDYNLGRTTTHELGHFYNLRHIWGDDDGACSGTDFPDAPAGQDDTPNQDDDTFGNPDPTGTGRIITDRCSPEDPGIMYQNFMDYSSDSALVMFTNGQFERMITALTLSPDRAAVLSSTAYQVPTIYTSDAWIRQVTNPAPSSSQCPTFTPTVILRNSGSQPLTTVQIISKLNTSALVVFNWTGNLAPYSEITISLPQSSGIFGLNNLVIYTSMPNGNADQRTVNDTSKTSFDITPVLPLTKRIEESFMSPTFPPKDWKVSNPDNDITWERNATIGKKQPGSAWFNDWNNNSNFLYDDLMMPRYSFTEVDSVILSFQLAAAVYSAVDQGIPIDTLTLLLTTDCGNTFTPIYKKWGAALQTINFQPEIEFFPQSQSQWRLDSVNLSKWLNFSEQQFQVLFRFNGNFENNIFIDDVLLYTKILPAKLKEKGYLISPTIVRDLFTVRHYQQATTLRYVNVYNSTGQLVWKKEFNGNAENLITVNLSGKMAGVYIVTLGYTDKNRNVSERIIKQ